MKSFTAPAIPAGVPYSALISTAIVGGPLALSPKNRVAATATYTIPTDVATVGKLSFGVTFTHTDSQFANRASDAFVPYLTGNVPAGQVPLQLVNYPLYGSNFARFPATDLLNLNGNWDRVLGSQFDLAFFMTNATNLKYPVGEGGSLLSAGFENYVYAPPRMFGFRDRYSFGR